MPKAKKYFKVKCLPFPRTLHFLFCYSKKEMRKMVVDKLTPLAKRQFDDIPITTMDGFFFRSSKIDFIWCKEFPYDPHNKGVLQHEILHAVYSILEDCGVGPLNPDTEEVYCHMQGYVTQKVEEELLK